MPPHQSNRNNQNTTPQPSFEITTDIAQSFIANRQSEIELEKKRLELQSRQLDLNAAFATRSLELQAEDIRRQPEENRKTFTHFSLVIGAFVLMLIGLFVYCLETGHETLVFTILKGVGVLITNVFSYYAGKGALPGSSKPAAEPPSAQVVE